MLLLTVDEHSPEPIYRQIIAQIRDKIAGRVLLPGEKLPSTRRLADQLAIHRSTAAAAYQELWALGFVDLSPGSCPRVRDRMQIATAADRGEKGLVDWQATASQPSDALWQSYRRLDPPGRESTPALINFASMNMDSRLFPLESFRACLDRAMKNHGDVLLGYGARAGFRPLREYIARRLQSHGISVTADEILITNGSQQGIDLVFRMIAAPGKTVAIEAPTYDYVLPLLRFYGLRPVEIPVRRDGMDLDALAAAIAADRPVLVYTMPTFQNPTGISTGQAHRERLLSLCEQHRIPILEDGFEEEMKYSGRIVLPVKSMDRHHLVIYCGTFSKVLFPGARVGWRHPPLQRTRPQHDPPGGHPRILPERPLRPPHRQDAPRLPQKDADRRPRSPAPHRPRLGRMDRTQRRLPHLAQAQAATPPAGRLESPPRCPRRRSDHRRQLLLRRNPRYIPAPLHLPP